MHKFIIAFIAATLAVGARLGHYDQWGRRSIAAHCDPRGDGRPPHVELVTV